MKDTSLPTPRVSTQDFNLDGLIHITPTTKADAGMLADAEIIGGGMDVSTAPGHTLWSRNYSMPTACFKFDKAAKTYGVPAPSNREYSSETGSACFSKTNPYRDMRDGFGHPDGTLTVLAIVFHIFRIA